MQKMEEFIRSISDFKVPKEKIVRIRDRFYLADNSELSGAKPYFAGDLLGEMKGSRFFPSLRLLEMISDKSSSRIKVGKKAAWLFLCKRDIFRKSVLEGDIKNGSYVLVQNEDNENLGLAKVEKDKIKNILDRGDFLRRERKERENTVSRIRNRSASSKRNKRRQ